MAKSGPYYEKRTFERGVDMDSALTGVEQGFSRYMLNCLIDNGVEVTNIKGNLVANYDPDFTFFKLHPDYGYRCIGSIYEPIFKKIYFFVVAKDLSPIPNYLSFIFEYDIAANLVTVVCDENWSDILLFEWDELITSRFIVFRDSVYPLLYWSQRAGLRKINIFKAKNIFHPEGYQDRTLEIVDRIKYQPRFKPVATPKTDVSYNYNRISNRFFQFCYRYVFDDYEVSTTSPLSDINTRKYFESQPLFYPFPSATGGVYTDKNYNNRIVLTLNTGAEIVRKIDIFVRIATSNLGVPVYGDWVLYDQLDKSILSYDDNVEVDYNFYNDLPGKIIAQSVVNQIFDNVPLAAVADELGQNSISFPANVTEGQDLEEIDITTETEFNVAGTGNDFVSTFSLGLGPDLVTINNSYKLPVTPPALNSCIRVEVSSGGTSFYYYQIKEEDLDNYPTQLQNSLVNGFNQTFSGNGIFAELVGDEIYIKDSSLVGIVQHAFVQTDPPDKFSEITKYSAFKSGATHVLCIYYKDGAGRISSAQRFEHDIPFMTQDPYRALLVGSGANGLWTTYTTINALINHTPPIWADRYAIGYAGNKNIGNFYQFRVSNMSIDANGLLLIDTDFFQTYAYKNQTFLNYEFVKGDRLRLIGSVGTTNIAWPDINIWGVQDGGDYLDVPILDAPSATTIRVSFNNILWSMFSTFINENIVIEVYRPKTALSGIFYEIYSNEIGDPGTALRYHKGDTNQVIGTSPAVVNLKKGDTYFRKRPLGLTTDSAFGYYKKTMFIEDPNYSDFPIYAYSVPGTPSDTIYNQSAVYNYGKPNEVNDNYKRVTRESTIWFSGQYISEANANGLSTFPDGQFRDYDINYGSIQKIVSTDRALKIFFELRCGWIPVGQEVSAAGAPQAFVLTTDKILTDMIYYEEKRGVGKHPESVVERAGVIYGLDPISGGIFRISRDGFTIISDVKNSQGNYLVRQSIFNAIKANTGNFVAGFNERRNSYEVNLGGITMVWDEQKNAWVGGRSYNAEFFSNAGVDLVSFYNGKLYLHEANSLACNFYGVQYKPRLWIVGNWQLFNKVYKALWMKSKTPWYAYDILNTVGQKSIIDKVRFSKREGIWYAAFRRDMNTVNIRNPIVDGKEIRDIAILVKLENDSVEYDFVNYIILNQIESK